MKFGLQDLTSREEDGVVGAVEVGSMLEGGGGGGLEEDGGGALEDEGRRGRDDGNGEGTVFDDGDAGGAGAVCELADKIPASSGLLEGVEMIPDDSSPDLVTSTLDPVAKRPQLLPAQDMP